MQQTAHNLIIFFCNRKESISSTRIKFKVGFAAKHCAFKMHKTHKILIITKVKLLDCNALISLLTKI